MDLELADMWELCASRTDPDVLGVRFYDDVQLYLESHDGRWRVVESGTYDAILPGEDAHRIPLLATHDDASGDADGGIYELPVPPHYPDRARRVLVSIPGRARVVLEGFYNDAGTWYVAMDQDEA